MMLIPMSAFSEGSWSSLNNTYYPGSEFAGYYHDYCLPYLQKHGYTNDLSVITNTNAYSSSTKQLFVRCGETVVYFQVEDYFAIHVYTNGVITSIINIRKMDEPYYYSELMVIH
jgi:hypothetical protein